jgi:hypothetical protein
MPRPTKCLQVMSAYLFPAGSERMSSRASRPKKLEIFIRLSASGLPPCSHRMYVRIETPRNSAVSRRVFPASIRAVRSALLCAIRFILCNVRHV